MRVLLVSHTAEPCGSNDVVMALLENIPETTEVRVAFLGDGPLAAATTAMGLSTEVVDAGRARELHRQPKTLVRLRSLARESDVVFSHVAKSQALAGWAARLAGTESVWYQHELPGSPRALHEIAAASRPALTIANSEFVAREHRQRWPRAEVVVVHPGIESPDASECRVHSASSGATVAVLSRLDRWKRVELSIAAFALAQADDPDLKLLVIGGEAAGKPNNGYMSELMQKASDSTLPGTVEFLGPLSNAKRKFTEIDVLVQLSKNEPFGLSVAEALSYGVPAVVSNDGGIVEIIEDGKSGFGVDPEATSTVAESLLRLTNDPAKRSEFGQAGRSRVSAELKRCTQAMRMWQKVGDIGALKR